MRISSTKLGPGHHDVQKLATEGYADRERVWIGHEWKHARKPPPGHRPDGQDSRPGVYPRAPRTVVQSVGAASAATCGSSGGGGGGITSGGG